MEVLEIVLEVKNTSETISVNLDRPDLIFGISFILVPKSYMYLDGKYIIHLITKKEIPIFLENVSEPHLGIPAHNDKDYEYAIINKLPIKQVIMPVNASLHDNTLREGKEWSSRQNVVLIVEHWTENKYLYIDYKNQN